MKSTQHTACNVGGSAAQRGFSLIELMVSITIGLVIMVASLTAYMGASTASKMTDAQSRMNEDAQAALAILAEQIRMAGNNPRQSFRTFESLYNPIYSLAPTTYTAPTPTFTFSPSPSTFTLSDFHIKGCDGPFASLASNINTLACGSGASDSIAIHYEGDAYSTIRLAGGQPSDCVGAGLQTITAVLPSLTVTATTPTLITAITKTTATYYVADNRYYVGTSTGITAPSLYCQGNGVNSSQQPLVENIESLQFLYGVGANAGDTTVAGYRTASEIGTTAAEWAKVLTVRVCVIARSEQDLALNATPVKYKGCPGTGGTATLVTPTDLKLRRAYSTTVVLRNRLP